MRRLKLALPFVLLAGLAAYAWPRAGGRADDELVLVSPHWEGIRDEFTWAFEEHWKAKTGRTVRMAWLDLGGTSKCIRYLTSADPGGAGADIVFGGGVDSYIDLTAVARPGHKERLCYLAPVELPPETLGAVPAAFGGSPLRDAKSRWFSACLSNFGISYNRPVLRQLGLPEPAEWTDLADPRFFNWVGSGEPRSSGAVHMTYELILQSYRWDEGWATVTRMAGNVRSFTEGGNGIPRDVAMGQFAAGGAIDFYAEDKVNRLGEKSMGFAVPRRLVVVNGDPIAVLEGAPHRAVAEEFVRFVLSDAGQRLWCMKPGGAGGPRRYWLARLPVRPALYDSAPPEIARNSPFASAGFGAYDFDKSSRRWRPLNELLGAAIIDCHDELRGAWKALIAAGLPAEGVAEFGAPPCSEEEFLATVERLWRNRDARDSDRNAQIAAWGRWAREKYDAVRRKYAR